MEPVALSSAFALGGTQRGAVRCTLTQGCRCSAIGPSASAGRKQSAPTKTTGPSTKAPNVGVSHGNPPDCVTPCLRR